MARVAAYVPAPPPTLLQSGSVMVTVDGATPFSSAYEIFRTTVDDLILEYIMLLAWDNSVTTATVDPVVTYSGFSPAICIYGKKKPLIDSKFVGGVVVVVHEELCGTIKFYGMLLYLFPQIHTQMSYTE
ncbi:unnamed protein product [marine sediment metagenome]|uniref:Uncharacterized protein n=1 Tax=marine sediment metagenome TaxID=412755 RepID=X1B848_9ZZZZ